ncbi:hypothetical protein ACFQL1_13850 [Halomicroarcula sp. GCM10025709]|uniref:DUF7263 family protein n=1 Tax=Haloarcula TaxID=2237 RepID=UPI0024C43A01|nr:hypothetical protein [Halomicroarcula sp. YJ-61-S]
MGVTGDRRNGTRAQTSLPSLAVALVLLTVVTGLALSVADGTLARHDRTPDEQRVAAATAERLVDPTGPLAARANVLNATQVDAFDRSRLVRAVPPARNATVTVSLNGSRLASTGTPDGGATVRRIVLVERRTTRSVTPNVTGTGSVTLPRRTTTATISISTPPGTELWTVRAGDRILLHNRSGLAGTFTVSLVPYETTELRFEGAGTVPTGSVTVAYAPPRTTKATLEVTVDG